MKTKLILEIGCNHQGSMDLARKMIDTAVELGVSGVKFQKRDIDFIPENIQAEPRDPTLNFGSTYGEHRKALEFTQDQMFKLKTHADSAGLLFSCTAFDPLSLKQLIEIGTEYIKFPSQLLLYDKMYVTYKEHKEEKTKLAVSTGMHTANEVFDALFYHPDIVYHCVSIYPAKPEQSNIKFIKGLSNQQMFEKSNGHGFKIGYSSHEIGGSSIPYAITAGATWVERHFTLDKNMKGHDHKTVSSTPKEITKIIELIKYAEDINGSVQKPLSEEELKIAKKYRGST